MGLFEVTTGLVNGFCPTVYSEIDKTIEYDVTGKITLSEFLGKEVSKKELLCVLDSLLDALIVARDKKMDLRNIVLDMDFVFVNPESAQVSFIVLPVVGQSYPADLNRFFKSLVFDLKFDMSDDAGYVAQLINYLNSSTHFIYEDFKAFIKNISGRRELEETLICEEAEDIGVDSDFVAELESVAEKNATPMFRHSARKELTAEEILKDK